MAGSFWRNPAREVASIEKELARRLGLMGVGLDDASALRAVFGRAAADARSQDLSGLVWLLARLATYHALAPDSLARRAMRSMLGFPAG